MLAHLYNPAPDGTAELHLRLFSGEQHEMGRPGVGVDERALVASRKVLAGQRLSDEQLCDALWHRCAYTVGEAELLLPHCRRGGQGGAGGRHRLARAFALQGDGVRFAVEEFTRPDGATIFLASKLTSRRSTDQAVRLARGSLRFVDWTAAGALGVLASAELTQLRRAATGSYLKRWDEYGEIEGDLFLERARAVGKLRIHPVGSTRNGDRVEVDRRAALGRAGPCPGRDHPAGAHQRAAPAT